MILNVKTSKGSYPIYLERGALSRAGEYLSLDRKCMIVTDSNIPTSYIETVSSFCGAPYVFTIEPGEDSKSLASFEAILGVMLEKKFTRTDCVVALGGGVVGDLAGFVASAFLRGGDFYNVPTTLLSQVDSSIGGKVAVNLGGLKNMVGAFYPPRAVLVDPETLSGLPRRQIANGLAESVKMALTFDEEFFRLFETGDPTEHLDKIIELSLIAKKRVVEEDEREAGLRRVLNFGHTLAHAIESESFEGPEPLYHGECVALGMIPMCAPEVRERLIPVLRAIGLPTEAKGDPARWAEAVTHDKKTAGDSITVVRVPRVGEFVMEKIPVSRFAEEVKGGMK
ncbi:MAG: 3-dehydroquinate synthase [Clostridia bacterium]|nr:3-dehydroquinate synthase [Clostridia bacterium]